MDTEAALMTPTADQQRLDSLQDTVTQADFYVGKALACQSDEHRQAILRIAKETLQTGLDKFTRSRLVDL